MGIAVFKPSLTKDIRFNTEKTLNLKYACMGNVMYQAIDYLVKNK